MERKLRRLKKKNKKNKGEREGKRWGGVSLYLHEQIL